MFFPFLRIPLTYRFNQQILIVCRQSTVLVDQEHKKEATNICVFDKGSLSQALLRCWWTQR